MTVTSLRRKPTWVQRTPDAPAVAVAGSPAVEPVEPTAPEAPPPSPPPLSDEVSDAGQVIGIVETMVRDGRSREGLMAAAEDDRLRQRTLDALREAGAAHDEDIVKEVASLAAQSNEQIEDAFASLLNSGRILNRIQAKIGPGGYKALFEAGIVNINMPTASKLRTIASAFDDGRIPKELQRESRCCTDPAGGAAGRAGVAGRPLTCLSDAQRAFQAEPGPPPPYSPAEAHTPSTILQNSPWNSGLSLNASSFGWGTAGDFPAHPW
jgi:hypothetical protein